MAAPLPRLRPDVSMPGLLEKVRESFKTIEDTRCQGNVNYPLDDTLMAALAMFSLKYPSLLQFDNETRAEQSLIDENLQQLFRLGKVPSDTRMREILDPIDPASLRAAFRAIHSGLQRCNALNRYHVFGDMLIVSLDGTQQFGSTSISCPHCCVRRQKRSTKSQDSQSGDEILHYYHQMLAAVMVHPDRRQALPMDAEPIVRSDGETKNDCEGNASKRLLASLARQYPKRKLIIVEDALSANGPHIRELQRHGMHFIIAAKPGNCETLFEELDRRFCAGEVEEWEHTGTDGVLRGYRMATDVPLNDTYKDLTVHSLEYWEENARGKCYLGHWITDLPLERDNAFEIMRIARSRWKIENETFNTLKNQGYNFGHSYGHGHAYLASVMGMLMLLAFLIDQVQEAFCRVFQDIRETHGSRRVLWERLRIAFTTVKIGSWKGFMAYWRDPRTMGFEIPP